jgi:cytochrome c oxidase subunit 1
MKTTATTVIERVPLFGRMFSVDVSTGLEEINTWPALFIMASFVWLAAAGLMGLLMPATQIVEPGNSIFYMFLTAHGAAMALPFAFQLMAGISLHRAGGCLGRPVTGILPKLTFWCMNGGALVLTLAILDGLKISIVTMWPLPLVGANLGEWSNTAVVLGFTGIALVLIAAIVLYPINLLWLVFAGEKRQELLLAERSLKDPGMLGMTMASLVLLISGTPLLIVAVPVLLALYGILPIAAVTSVIRPVVFQYAFYIWAHNLMEAMALMAASAVYATLPLYLADGSRKLFSDRLANLGLWVILGTSITSFFHHFFTFIPNQPAILDYWGNIMSWGTGVGAAISIFTVLGTIWEHGLLAEPGVLIVLTGFALYILDGISAIMVSNVAWNYHLHGTMWVSGHSMTAILSIAVMWLGVLYHHYPVITGREIERNLGYWFVDLFVIGGFGTTLVMLAGGAAGMPRRFAAWSQGGWMPYGILLLIFGIILGLAFVLYAYGLMKSREAEPVRRGVFVPAVS